MCNMGGNAWAGHTSGGTEFGAVAVPGPTSPAVQAPNVAETHCRTLEPTSHTLTQQLAPAQPMQPMYPLPYPSPQPLSCQPTPPLSHAPPLLAAPKGPPKLSSSPFCMGFGLVEAGILNLHPTPSPHLHVGLGQLRQLRRGGLGGGASHLVHQHRPALCGRGRAGQRAHAYRYVDEGK